MMPFLIRGAAVAATLCASFFSIFAVVAILRAVGISPERLHDPAWVFHPTTIVAILAILSAPLLVVLGARALGLRAGSLSLREAGGLQRGTAGFVLGFALKAATTLAAAACSKTIVTHSMLTGIRLADWLPFFAWYAVLLVANSLSEEIVYRVFPLEELRGAMHPAVVVVLAACAFSLVHFATQAPDLAHFFYRTAFGILAGLLYLQSRSLWLIVGFHTGWNLVAVSLSTTDWRTGGLLRLEGVSADATIWANVIGLALAAVFALRMIRRSSALSV